MYFLSQINRQALQLTNILLKRDKAIIKDFIDIIPLKLLNGVFCWEYGWNCCKSSILGGPMQPRLAISKLKLKPKKLG
jgi:hypothetical protein